MIIERPHDLLRHQGLIPQRIGRSDTVTCTGAGAVTVSDSYNSGTVAKGDGRALIPFPHLRRLVAMPMPMPLLSAQALYPAQHAADAITDTITYAGSSAITATLGRAFQWSNPATDTLSSIGECYRTSNNISNPARGTL